MEKLACHICGATRPIGDEYELYPNEVEKWRIGNGDKEITIPLCAGCIDAEVEMMLK